MYTKDKSNRITLRLNDDQFNFVKAHSDMLGVSPSEFLRMVVNSSMAMERQITIKASLNPQIGGSERRENEQTNINDQL